MNEKTITLMNKLLLSLQEIAPINFPIRKPRNIVKLSLSIHFIKNPYFQRNYEILNQNFYFSCGCSCTCWSRALRIEQDR